MDFLVSNDQTSPNCAKCFYLLYLFSCSWMQNTFILTQNGCQSSLHFLLYTCLAPLYIAGIHLDTKWSTTVLSGVLLSIPFFNHLSNPQHPFYLIMSRIITVKTVLQLIICSTTEKIILLMHLKHRPSLWGKNLLFPSHFTALAFSDDTFFFTFSPIQLAFFHLTWWITGKNELSGVYSVFCVCSLWCTSAFCCHPSLGAPVTLVDNLLLTLLTWSWLTCFERPIDWLYL